MFTVGESHSTDAGFVNQGVSDAVAIKFDKDGNKVWESFFGGNKYDILWHAVELDNGDLVAVGRSHSTDNGFSDSGMQNLIVAKFDKDGDIKVSKRLASGSNHEYAYGLLKYSNEELFVVGSTASSDGDFSSNGGDDIYVLKMDSLLNIAWIKTWGGSSTDKAIEIFKTMDDNIVITGYGDSTEAGFDNEANKRYCFLIKFDVDGNILWKRAIRSTVNSNNYYATSLLELNGDLYIVGDYTCDNGTTSDIFLVKMKVEYTMIPESISKESSVFFSPDNTLELSLSTSTVIFENFSYTESVEKKSALDLIVSSTLQYGIKVSIVSDIIGATYGEIVDNSILNIKPSSESSYKQFSSSVKTLQLYENQPIGNSVVHSVDMKLAGKKMNRTDVYKAVLKFEVEQI